MKNKLGKSDNESYQNESWVLNLTRCHYLITNLSFFRFIMCYEFRLLTTEPQASPQVYTKMTDACVSWLRSGRLLSRLLRGCSTLSGRLSTNIPCHARTCASHRVPSAQCRGLMVQPRGYVCVCVFVIVRVTEWRLCLFMTVNRNRVVFCGGSRTSPAMAMGFSTDFRGIKIIQRRLNSLAQPRYVLSISCFFLSLVHNF